jgi:hypothetical protein
MTYKVVTTEDLTVVTTQVAGVQGAKGDTGSTGAAGATGATGATGSSGVIGVDAGELTNTGTSTAAQLGLATAGTAGTYTKVTTDTFGRVTSGTTLSSTDVPDLAAAKITSGTLDTARIPSTINGTSIPSSSTLVTTATTSLPTVTSVNSTTIPASSILVTSSTYRQSQLTPSGAVDIIPRLQVSGTRAVNAGTISFTGFTPIADMTLSKISVNVTAVSGTPTLQFGVYSISAMTATCLGSSSVSSAISGTGLVELSLTSSVSLTAGTNYLIAFLPVGGTSATFSGANINNSSGLQGNGTSGVFAPLIAAQSSSTTKTVMTTVGSTETLSGTVVAGFVFARLNNP